MVEVPILMPENKDYYVCMFDVRSRAVVNCTSLVKGRQDNFMSSDFDLRSPYALILEKGLGIYDLRQIPQKSLNCTRWITESELEDLGIIGPFTYIQIIGFFDSGLTFEIGTEFESFEVSLKGDSLISSSMEVKFHYMKYIQCEYDKYSKPKYHK